MLYIQLYGMLNRCASLTRCECKGVDIIVHWKMKNENKSCSKAFLSQLYRLPRIQLFGGTHVHFRHGWSGWLMLFFRRCCWRGLRIWWRPCTECPTTTRYMQVKNSVGTCHLLQSGKSWYKHTFLLVCVFVGGWGFMWINKILLLYIFIWNIWYHWKLCPKPWSGWDSVAAVLFRSHPGEPQLLKATQPRPWRATVPIACCLKEALSYAIQLIIVFIEVNCLDKDHLTSCESVGGLKRAGLHLSTTVRAERKPRQWHGVKTCRDGIKW